MGAPKADGFLPGPCLQIADGNLDGYIDEAYELTYDQEGRKVESHSLFEDHWTEFEYDDQDRLIEIREFRSGVHAGTGTYEYDAQGRLIVERLTGQDGQLYKNTNIYDDAGRVIRTEREQSNAGEVSQGIEYEYDGDNLVEERFSSGTGDELGSMTMVYDGDRVIESETSIMTWLVELTEYEYDDHGDGTYTRSAITFNHPDGEASGAGEFRSRTDKTFWADNPFASNGRSPFGTRPDATPTPIPASHVLIKEEKGSQDMSSIHEVDRYDFDEYGNLYNLYWRTHSQEGQKSWYFDCE